MNLIRLNRKDTTARPDALFGIKKSPPQFMRPNCAAGFPLAVRADGCTGPLSPESKYTDSASESREQYANQTQRTRKGASGQRAVLSCSRRPPAGVLLSPYEKHRNPENDTFLQKKLPVLPGLPQFPSTQEGTRDGLKTENARSGSPCRLNVRQSNKKL